MYLFASVSKTSFACNFEKKKKWNFTLAQQSPKLHLYTSTWPIKFTEIPFHTVSLVHSKLWCSKLFETLVRVAKIFLERQKKKKSQFCFNQMFDVVSTILWTNTEKYHSITPAMACKKLIIKTFSNFWCSSWSWVG